MPLDQCTISGTAFDEQGNPVSGVRLTVVKVIKSGVVIQIKPRALAKSNAEGVFERATDEEDFLLPRNCTAWLKGKFYNGATNYNVKSGVAVVIPNAETATLESLGAAATVPTQGLTVKSEGDSLANLIGTLNFGAGFTVTESPTGTALIDTVVSGATIAAHIANVSNPHAVTKTQVGLGNADNTSDALKPVSTATQAALDLKATVVDLNSEITARGVAEALLAPLASPTFTGTPLAPTPINATNSTQLATTAFVHAVVADLIGAAPAAFDTLVEIANQLATDESAVSALTTTVSGKLAKASNLSDLTNAATARTNLGLVAVAASGSAADLIGNLAVARLNSGTGASAATFWCGDGTWKAAGSTSASDLSSGTLPDGRFPATLPALSGANLTALSAAAISGVIPIANLATGTPDGTKFLRDDGVLAVPSGAPSGAAGGDLSGTYPNPAVAKINGISITGTPSIGQVPVATSASAATWQTPAGGGVAVSDDPLVWTGKQTFSKAGALSAPAISITGAPIATGGTSTTTKPLVLIETAGATSTAWSLVGTMLAVNAPSGFTGNLIDLQLAGVSSFKVASGGAITATSAVFGSGGFIQFGTRGYLQPNADGVWSLHNNAGSDFSRLQFGGTTSSFPAIKRNATAINFRLADDSADAAITAAGATFSGRIIGSGAGASSAPGLLLTGVWQAFTGGSTDWPLFLIQPIGVTSTSWNTAGTGIGINNANASGFGNYVDFKLDGTTKFKVDKQGNVTANRIDCASGISSMTGLNMTGLLTMADGQNIVTNTATGTKIGTATGQKISFWNVNPVVQQVLATGAGKTVDEVITLLQLIGLCRQA